MASADTGKSSASTGDFPEKPHQPRSIKFPMRDTDRDTVNRLSDNIKEICGLTMVELERKAQDRNNWRSLVRRATAVRQRTTRS